MLQQTRMNAVLPYYERFMRELPTPAALAACSQDRLHKLWEGLGYYSRADNLLRAARIIVEKYGGELPHTYEELRALPGIGDYTAGAVASISYNLPVPAVDGNVMRVFARLYNDRADITSSATKKRFSARVTENQPPDSAGDYNQALMELGALICTPGEPRCAECPLNGLCAAYAAGSASSLPVKAEKKPRRIEYATVLLIRSEAGFLLMRRSENGLLAGLWQPLTYMEPLTQKDAGARIRTLLSGAHTEFAGKLPAARHLFTHIEWQLSGWEYKVPGIPPLPDGYVWALPKEMNSYAIPNAFKAYKSILYGKSPR